MKDEPKPMSSSQIARLYRVPPWLVDLSIRRPGFFGRLRWWLRWRNRVDLVLTLRETLRWDSTHTEPE